MVINFNGYVDDINKGNRDGKSSINSDTISLSNFHP